MLGFHPLAAAALGDDGGVVSSGTVATATGSAATGSVGSVTIAHANTISPTGVSASAGPHATVRFAVTVANSGSGNKFYIDGAEAPTLNLVRNTTYIFDVSDGSNSGHPFRFKDSGGSSYSTGVTTSGTEGSSGATVT